MTSGSLPLLLSATLVSCLSFALSCSLSCSPGSGAIRLEARAGTVVDAATQQPLAAADVFQVYWGRGIAGEPRPAYAVRLTTTDDEGRFAFAETLSDAARTWVLETDPAEYGFFHPSYGLVRTGAPAPGTPLVLEGKPLDEAGRRADVLARCGSRPTDAVLEALARLRCPGRTRPQE